MSEINNDDVFELLNSEFENFELERENARNLENLRRRQALTQQQQDVQPDDEVDFGDYDEESGGSGCIGTAFRILIILLLACAVAWLVFMPEGSVSELWDKVSPRLESSWSWATDLWHNGFSADSPHTAVSASDNSSENNTRGFTTAASERNQTASTASTASSAEVSDTPQNTDKGDSPYSIKVFRPSQLVIVYDSTGSPAKVFSCSSGKTATPTRIGDYAIRAKYRWRFMVGNCYTQYASSFSSGYLFHSIPYDKKNPGTMYNSSYDKLGNPASSGCIRLCLRDTKWIYDNCPIGTPVQVVDESAPAGSTPEIIPERIKDSGHNGWDPTDDSPDSPYNK